MTGTDPKYDEARLQAWLDDELSPDEAAAVGAWVAANPEVAARVERWRRNDALLRQSFEPVATEPVPARLTAIVGRPTASVPRWAAMAAGVVLFLLGGVVGWQLNEHAEPGAPMLASLAEQAVRAHAVFSVEVRHPVEVTAAEHVHLAKWLSKRLGRTLRIPDLTGADFTLVGGRLLASNTGPAALLMYEDPTGRRLTVYGMPGLKPRETAFRFADAEGLSAFYWVDGGFGFALVGPLDREALLEIAQVVHEKIR